MAIRLVGIGVFGKLALYPKWTLAELASWPYSARMTQTDRPDDWVIYATLGVFAVLMICYAIWAIRSGSFYMRPGWRVSRQEEPGHFWFVVITALLVFPVAIGITVWELNR